MVPSGACLRRGSAGTSRGSTYVSTVSAADGSVYRAYLTRKHRRALRTSVQITMDRYSHLFDQSYADESAKLEAALFGRSVLSAPLDALPSEA